MTEAQQLFEGALSWLETSYADFRFFTERDVVWTIQTHLLQLIDARGSALRLLNDYPLLEGRRRGLSADLVLLPPHGPAALAVEFKYEPSHARGDIPSNKFPVVDWGNEGVAKDIARIHEFVAQGKALAGESILIDEGGYFAKKPPHPGSQWHRWAGGVFILRARAG